MRTLLARRNAALMLGVTALVSTVALSGCAGNGDANPTPNSTNENYVINNNAKAPEFVPDGTAEYNVSYLAHVVAQTQAQSPKLDADEVAEKVASAGFTRKGIQYTFAATAVGLDSDSVFIAVPWGEKCMIAQYGPAISGIHKSVLPVLKQGGCLIGPTVQTLR